MFKLKLEEVLKDRRMTKCELADRIDVSASAITNFVHGRSYPRIDTFYRMCRVLHCKPEDLVDFDD